MATTTNTTSSEGVDFAVWITNHRKGAANAELSEAINEVIAACQATGKSGTVTLTLTFGPKGSDRFGVTDTVKFKAPTEREERTYWLDANGALTDRHPNQPALGFDPETGEIQ